MKKKILPVPTGVGQLLGKKGVSVAPKRSVDMQGLDRKHVGSADNFLKKIHK